MKKIKEIIKKISNSSNFPLLIFFIILIIVHIQINYVFGDDLNALMVKYKYSISDYMFIRYTTWSSRILIDITKVFIYDENMILWRILNIGIYIILAKSISKICFKEENKTLNYIICALILLIPIKCLNGAGWVATTTNYLWVVSFALYSLSIIINYMYKIKIDKLDYIAYLFATLYASNHEQMVVVMFLVLGGFILEQLIKKGYKYVIKNEKFLLILFTITILSLIFILVCPGNSIRMTRELKKYPEFEFFSIIDKISLGLTSTMKELVLNTNLLFIFFTLAVFIVGWIYNKKKYIRIICIIPFLMSIFSILCTARLEHLFPNILEIKKIFSVNELIEFTNENFIQYIGWISAYIITLICIPMGIYFIFKKNIRTFWCISIYLLGLITRIIMCFSPTIFISGERTFIFMYISFIMCTVMILENVTEGKHKLLLLKE